MSSSVLNDPVASSVLELKFANKSARPQRHTRESGYLVGAGFNPALTSGFRVALGIASLPGMTPKLFNGFWEHHTR